MKAKLGKLALVEKLPYGNYAAILKKEVKAIVRDAKSGGFCKYVLIAGEHLSWKGEPNQDSQPLLYLAPKTSSLVKDVKANKEMDVKSYSYGICKLVDIGSAVEVQLCPDKGKLAQPAQIKPLAKVFKKFKPKLFFSVVDGFDETLPSGLLEEETAEDEAINETTTADDTNQTEAEDAEDNDAAADLQKIGTALEKYHVIYTKIKSKLEKVEGTEKQKFLVERNKVIKHLKHLCDLWTEEVLPHTDLLGSPEAQKWSKIYDAWQKMLAKLVEPETEEKEEEDDAPEPTAEDKVIIDAHIEKIKNFATLKDLEDYSKTVKEQANTPATIAFAKTVEGYIKHLNEVNVHINDLLDAQEEVNAELKKPNLSAEEKAELEGVLKQLEEDLDYFINNTLK